MKDLLFKILVIVLLINSAYGLFNLYVLYNYYNYNKRYVEYGAVWYNITLRGCDLNITNYYFTNNTLVLEFNDYIGDCPNEKFEKYCNLIITIQGYSIVNGSFISDEYKFIRDYKCHENKCYIDFRDVAKRNYYIIDISIMSNNISGKIYKDIYVKW